MQRPRRLQGGRESPAWRRLLLVVTVAAVIVTVLAMVPAALCKPAVSMIVPLVPLVRFAVPFAMLMPVPFRPVAAGCIAVTIGISMPWIIVVVVAVVG